MRKVYPVVKTKKVGFSWWSLPTKIRVLNLAPVFAFFRIEPVLFF
jgi:hypothetical protein